MLHRARPFALLLSFMAAGCADSADAPAGGEDPSDETPSTMEMESSEEARLQLTVDGRVEPMNAQAQIEVVEGEREVPLTITGADGADLVMIDLAFDGVENVSGEHAMELGSPESDGPYAVAVFQGQQYESDSGGVELVVSSDGSINGSFDIPLVQASPGAAEAAGVEPVTVMTGAFSGTWSLSCRSPIRGFTGGHSVSDSPYCNSLQL